MVPCGWRGEDHLDEEGRALEEGDQIDEERPWNQDAGNASEEGHVLVAAHDVVADVDEVVATGIVAIATVECAG